MKGERIWKEGKLLHQRGLRGITGIDGRTCACKNGFVLSENVCYSRDLSEGIQEELTGVKGIRSKLAGNRGEIRD